MNSILTEVKRLEDAAYTVLGAANFIKKMLGVYELEAEEAFIRQEEASAGAPIDVEWPEVGEPNQNTGKEIGEQLHDIIEKVKLKSAKPCKVCGFATNPPHDHTAHYYYRTTKIGNETRQRRLLNPPFTKSDLKLRGLEKVKD